MQVEPSPSSLSGGNSIREALSETKSKRSAKTKTSQAVTEVVDNRAAQHDSSIMIEESREPSQQHQTNIVDHDSSRQLQELRVPTPKQLQDPRVPTPGQTQEQRAPTPRQPQEQRSPTPRQPQEQRAPTPRQPQEPPVPTQKQPQGRRVPTPFEVVPGLEGDDIVPGLSARVHGARSTLKNVLSFMSGSREDGVASAANFELQEAPSTKSVDFPSRAPYAVPNATMPQVTNKEMKSFMSPEDAPYMEASPNYPSVKPPLTFWQRMTCYSSNY